MTSARYQVSVTEPAAEARFELAGQSLVVRAALDAAGLAVPPAAKAIATSGDVRVAQVGPRRWLVWAPMAAAQGLHAKLCGALPPLSSALAADVTGAAATFVLRGRDVQDVLAQGIAQDLSLAGFPAGTILATEGFGVGLLLERDAGSVRVTTDSAYAAYIGNCLRTAAGQATEARPGVMRAPPPPITVAP